MSSYFFSPYAPFHYLWSTKIKRHIKIVNPGALQKSDCTNYFSISQTFFPHRLFAALHLSILRLAWHVKDSWYCIIF